MLNRFLIFVILALLTFPGTILAQCSDAGVCTVGRTSYTSPQQFGVSYVYGKSKPTDELTFHSVRFDGEVQILTRSRISFTIPYNSQSGPLGTVTGVGDLTILLSQSLPADYSLQWSIQIGARIATTDVNGGNLAQAYQSGLGTNDLLFGLSASDGEWSGSLAYQFSSGRSENSKTRLKRGDDLFVRAGYKRELDNFTLSGELLAIKRLQESSVRDPSAAIPDVFVTLPGSDQFQINVVGNISYPVDEVLILVASGALPLLKRDINVDGLTRAVSLSAGIQYTF